LDCHAIYIPVNLIIAIFYLMPNNPIPVKTSRKKHQSAI